MRKLWNAFIEWIGGHQAMRCFECDRLVFSKNLIIRADDVQRVKQQMQDGDPDQWLRGYCRECAHKLIPPK